MASSGKRTRGPNKQTPWSRNPDDGVSVLRLALDTSDTAQRARIEAMFDAAYQIRRAVQRDAQSRCRALWAATHERAKDSAATRDRLGLSRAALEHAAYSHLDGAPHLRRSVTKALAMHLADTVWTATERHLFRDVRGKRHGLLHTGRYFDFRRLPGRARSHTAENKWETFRLHGSLDGHRATYTDADGAFVQPRRLRRVVSDAWWRYTGPLAIVFTGLSTGALILPVRLPTAPSNQPILDHHLADPSGWHKVDLVRWQDPNAPGGWRYEAHLMVLARPYVSPATSARRAQAAIAAADRSAGIDVNVSNVTVASHDNGRQMRVTRIEHDDRQKLRNVERRRRERRSLRALDRSRRAMNRAQYQMSKRQEKRARRRAEAGLRAVAVVPMGPRAGRAAGIPVQRHERDQLSKGFRTLRSAHAAAAAAAAQARRHHAREVAAEIVAAHGYQFVVEDTNIAAWSRSWGRALAALSPGTIIKAIDREATAVAALAGAGGGVHLAATATTAMSQHCPCGVRVEKRLADRVHRCRACGLAGDRDAVAAVLASFVVFRERDVPTSARVDYPASCEARAEILRVLTAPKLSKKSYQGWQDTLSESTDLSARDGSFIAWWTSTPDSLVVARRNVRTAACSTRNETGARQTTSDRQSRQADMFHRCGLRWTYARDHS